MDNNIQATKFEFVDRLKGFAILCVVMGHFVFFSLEQTDVISEIIGSFQMPLFMFLSGFVISKFPSVKKTLKKVVIFMLPMVIVGSLFVVFSGSTYSVWIHSPFKHGYWYLYVLSVFYLLLCLIGYVAKERGFFIILSAFIVYAALLAINHVIPSKWNDILSIWMLKLYWPFFIIAFVVRRFNFLSFVADNNFLYGISLISYVIGFILYTNVPYLFHITAFFFILSAFYFFHITERFDNFISRGLSYLGKHTLDIYIFHFFIIHITNLKELGIWFTDTNNYFIELAVGIMYCVLVALLCVYIGKTIKLSNFINDIVYGSFVNRKM